MGKQQEGILANSRQPYSAQVTNEYLASVGYDDILERYKVLHSNY